MRPRYSPRLGFQANPFVVMTDLCVCLVFILAVFSVTSMVAWIYDSTKRRQEVQMLVSTELASVLATQAGGSYEFDETQSAWEVRANGRRVAAIWLNGNFLRVMYFDTPWQPGSTFVGKEAGRIEDVYRPSAEVIKRHAGKLAYLFVHGLVERAERASDPERLSRSRASAVYEQLRVLRVIGPAMTSEVMDTGSQLWDDPQGGHWIPAKYAVSYGTGTDLYVSGGPVGRVDLVLFFRDSL